MKEWFSVSELVGLPGVATTRMGIWKQATKGQWQGRERQGKGGGNEYHISSLPEATRLHLLSQQPKSEAVQLAEVSCAKDLLQEKMQAAVKGNIRDQGIKDYLSLTGKKKECADAKLAVITAYKQFQTLFPKRGEGAVDGFLKAFHAGCIAIDETIREEFHSLDRSTLYRWLEILEKQGAGALSDNRGMHRKGQSIIETQPDLLEYCVTKLFKMPHISCANIHQSIKADFSGKGLKLPGIKSVERFVNKYKTAHPDLILAATNPDRFKNQTMTAFGNTTSDIDHLNQRWLADSSPADLMLKEGRYSLIAIIDLYSRRAKLLVTKTSKATAISLLLRHCILDWGVPEELKTDNGTDYASKHLENCALMLGFKQNFSAPFSPWEKPHVERFFKTFSHDMLPMMEGFIGHNVADQQEIRARQSFADRLYTKNELIDAKKLDVKAFQKFCDEWCAIIYEKRGHGGLNNKTPAEMAAEYRGTIVRISDERQLDLLLAEAPSNGGWRKVGKKGIKLDNEEYVAPELELYIGFEVQVKYDPSDMGVIWVYAYRRPDDPFTTQPNEDGLHFVCKAYCGALLGADRQQVAIEARKIQTKRIQEGKKAVKQASRKHNHEEAVQRIIEHNRKEQSAKNVVYLPNRNVVEHDGPGMQATKSALEFPKTQFDIDAENFAKNGSVVEFEKEQKYDAIQRPSFEGHFDKGLWLVEAWMQGVELNGSEIEFLTTMHLYHQVGYSLLMRTLNDKYSGNEQYSEFKKLMNWL